MYIIGKIVWWILILVCVCTVNSSICPLSCELLNLLKLNILNTISYWTSYVASNIIVRIKHTYMEHHTLGEGFKSNIRVLI